MYRNRKRTFNQTALKILTPIPLPETISGKIQKNGSVIESLLGSDRTPLACRVWHGLPEHCVILYLHGIEGHSQWFEPTARVLNERGMTIYAADRRGSGLNTEDRGHLRSLKIFLADVESLLRQVNERHPAQPVVLFANCWSAKAAAVIASRKYQYADRKPPVRLAGLVMTCPAIVTSADFDWLSKVKIALSSFGSEQARKRAWPVPLTTEMLTDNPPYLEYLRNDPLRLKTATASFFRETFILGLLAQKFAKEIDLPLLLLQAENDRIVDVNQLKRWFDKVGSKNKEWRLYANATHSLDFDASWFNEYTDVLSEWLMGRKAVIAP